MTEAETAFRAALRTYFNSNNADAEALKGYLERLPDDPKAVLIRQGLREAIDTSSISPGAVDGLANRLMDDQEEVDAWLTAIWAYLFEDGPHPDGDEDDDD